jgi:hypothetical protein
MSDIGTNTYEPKRGMPQTEREPLSVVVFVTDPHKLTLLWASVLRQTHRPIEFFIMNQARNFITRIEISQVRTRIEYETAHAGITIGYMEGYDRIRAVRRAKHDRLLLLDQTSQLERGHVESLLSTEKRTGKRAVASYLVLGEHGGFDTAEAVVNKNSSAQTRLRLGMFLMRKSEMARVNREMCRAAGRDVPYRLDTSFLKAYWKVFMSKKRSVGTKMPTQIVEFSRL